ncbi:hypothetical protein L2E82_30425 [Cichorium intybus]|uniref:Uncharacterized protein n=1 Tax=Cichorium intybus TaxID=13427 RepID=A0ACB9D0C5_CICIN|nr:hypothetical protein L2E82_30425 [Cichorium intybus]
MTTINKRDNRFDASKGSEILTLLLLRRGRVCIKTSIGDYISDSAIVNISGVESKIRVIELTDPVFIPQSFTRVNDQSGKNNDIIDSDEDESDEFEDSDDEMPEGELPEDFSGEEDERSSDESVVQESNFEAPVFEDTHASPIEIIKKAEMANGNLREIYDSNQVNTESKSVEEAQSPSVEARLKSPPENLKEKSNGSEPQSKKGVIRMEDIPEELNGISTDLKILLFRSTPIKEKLEKVSNSKSPMQTISDQGNNGEQDKRGKRRTPIFEKRITRSQKRQAWKQQGWVQDQSNDSVSGVDSSISAGISNRMEEIGEISGFGKRKVKGIDKKQGGWKGVINGNK